MSNTKYNRTFHLPFSKGATSDDKIASDISSLLNKKIIISEKMDGSNACLETDGCFARSHSGPPSHPSFDGLKALHAQVKSDISSNIQIFGEWCFAKHSIKYEELPGYFLLFNVRNKETNMWEAWDIVELYASVIGCFTVPILWEGIFTSEKSLEKQINFFMNQPSQFGGEREGVVIRLYDEFHNKDFSKSVMKNVRANHIRTDQHWLHQEIVRNNLK